jgi:hypothetical protein
VQQGQWQTIAEQAHHLVTMMQDWAGQSHENANKGLGVNN